MKIWQKIHRGSHEYTGSDVILRAHMKIVAKISTTQCTDSYQARQTPTVLISFYI